MVSWVWALLLASTALVWGKEVEYYRTEPAIKGQTIEIQEITDDRSLLAPGYLFFAPSTWVMGWGPQIYDIDGLMLWNGKSHTDGIAQQFHACDYNGTSGQHLCWHEASKLGALRQGQRKAAIHDYNRVFDNSYKQLSHNYTTVGKLDSTPDSHEFHAVDQGKSYVQTVYKRRLWDLSPWTGPKEDGWILDSCFTDIEFVTEKVVFEWCYTDHLDIETHIYVRTPQQTNFTTELGGDGSWFFPWDFFHINSIDKNDEGDYLVSGRHNDQILKIAGPASVNGKAGEVLWKLGGDSNQFKYEGDLTFARQHDARYVHTEAEWTLFTIFDNAWEGEAPEDTASQPESSGKLIGINNKTMTVRLIQQYKHPEGHLSRSGGSMQMLPNKNMFLGWGFIREVTEFSYDGKVLFHAHLRNTDGLGNSNYRNFKFPWVGQPWYEPKLIAYTRYCTSEDAASPLLAYVSWNGATEVARWQSYTSRSSRGPWTKADTIDKDGFETRIEVSDHFQPYVLVEAIDKDGNKIGNASVATFVPNEEAIQTDNCDDDGCHDENFHYSIELSMAKQCEVEPEPEPEPELSTSISTPTPTSISTLTSTSTSTPIPTLTSTSIMPESSYLTTSGIFIFVVVCLELLGWFYHSILFMPAERPTDIPVFMKLEHTSSFG